MIVEEQVPHFRILLKRRKYGISKTDYVSLQKEIQDFCKSRRDLHLILGLKYRWSSLSTKYKLYFNDMESVSKHVFLNLTISR